MAEIHHLPNAPISEAIIDFRVKANLGFTVDKFNEASPILKQKFPVVEKMYGGQVNFQLNTTKVNVPEVKDLGIQGYFYKNMEQNLIAQFRVDGFTLNKLKPYTSWEEIYPLAIELWETYKSIVQPEAVLRIALRYINHIMIRDDQIDFDEYFTAAPKVPLAFPQNIERFLYRTTIVEPEHNNKVHVTQVFERQPSISENIVILDIDTFKDINIQPNDQNLLDYFRQLRSLKNTVFFSYLTDKTIGLFK